MESLNKYAEEYKTQVSKGDIVKAYRGLMEYLSSLRNYLAVRYPDYAVSSLYFGYMDMSYFSFTPPELRDKKLKIALVLMHDSLRFEIWLAAANRQIQSQYIKLFSEKGFDKYSVSTAGKGVDSIVESVITDKPDFDSPERLSAIIEEKTLLFIKDILTFLSENAL